ncbi:MAG: metallophosphoesterase [Phycisphaerales bacterium]|nr:MAG: metallophosphoesterase [Phycisphaerales bacterium]
MRHSITRNARTTLILCMHIIVFAFGAVTARASEPGSEYSFVYLGDLHFDKESHHDFEWVRASMPRDIRQIEDYVRITEKHTPGLFKRIQTSIESSGGRIKMIVQGGDLTEGLCGSRELQEKQFRDVRAYIRKYIPQTPFIATKGNHDITGPGAREAFDRVMLPWLSQECEKPIGSASFYLTQGPDLFVFFDAYHDNSLDWLEKTLSENTHRHAFVVMHPPAVPYNARSTWHVFSREKDKDVRERFLNILGANNVILFTAHLHKYSVVERKTPTGSFIQFSVNSVISSPEVKVANALEGIESYGGSLVDLEPEFQPDTKQTRIESLEAEKPYITRFEFADFPGYAIINVSDSQIEAEIYKGHSSSLWKKASLVTAAKK